MGKFNEMTIIENVQSQAEFVPSNVMLGGVPTSIVWRSRLGPVKVVQAGYKDATKSALVIVLEDGSRYTCLSATFGGGGGCIGCTCVLIKLVTSLKPAISISLDSVLAYCCKLTKGLFGPSCCNICSCLPANAVSADIFSSSLVLDIPTLTTISLSLSQYLGSTGIN